MDMKKLDISKWINNENEIVYLIIIYSAYLFLPTFTQVIKGIGNLGIIIMFFLVLCTIKGKIVFCILNNSFPLLLFFILEMIFSYIYGFREISNIMVSYLNITTVFFMIYLIPHLTDSNKIKILKWTLIFNFITSAITLYYLYTNSEYSRMLMHASESDGALRSGAGGFSFVYCNILITVTLFVLQKKFNGKLKVISLVALITNVCLIFKASFTLALFISILILGLLIFCSIDLKLPVKIISLPIVIILIIVIYLNLVDILNMFAGIMPSGSVKVRIMELSNAFADRRIEEDTDLFYRFRAYVISFKTFIKYPFGGLLFSGVLADQAYFLQGWHSHILDYLAFYGVLTLPYFLVWRKIYKIVVCDTSLKKYLRVAWVGFLIIAMLNTIGVNMMLFYMGIILPITLSLSDIDGKGEVIKK